MRSLSLLSFFLLLSILVACAPVHPSIPSSGEVPGNRPVSSVIPSVSEMPSSLVTSTPIPTFSLPTMIPMPYMPRNEDARLMRGVVFLESADVLVMESYPPQYVLNLQGALPTPCHELRVQAQPPDAEGNVWIEVYSVTDPQKICIQVLKPFAVQIPLLSGTGEYTFWVNGKKVNRR